jgi:hypothetical protein
LRDYGAARAIDYCRRKAAGAENNEESEGEMIDFLIAHNQPLDWVFVGDAHDLFLGEGRQFAPSTATSHRLIRKALGLLSRQAGG